MNCSSVDETDFSGIPTVVDGVTVYNRPDFMNYDILFLDELDKISNDSVISSLLSLFTDYSINGHDFKGKFITAGNIVDDEYNNYEFSKALKDRLVKIDFKRSKKESIEYYSRNHTTSLHTEFISYLHSTLDVSEEYFQGFSPRRIDQALNMMVTGDELVISEILDSGFRSAFYAFRSELENSLDKIISGVVTEYDFSSTLRYHHINQLKNRIAMKEITVEQISKLHDYINTFNGDDTLSLKKAIFWLIDNHKNNMDIVGKELFSNELLIEFREKFVATAIEKEV